MNTFSPDLIVEVTSVCDRACNGCYAPNVVSKEDAATLAKQNPALFLAPTSLGLALSQLPVAPRTISIRGGEPTRHPDLVKILVQCARIAPTVLETHGRWLLSDEADSLLLAIQSHNVVVKISFDSMHGTSAVELKKMVSILTTRKISFLVAITESSSEQFTATRSLCNFIKGDFIIFQKKAVNSDELLRPSIGVIGLNGILNSTLSHREGIFKRSLSA